MGLRCRGEKRRKESEGRRKNRKCQQTDIRNVCTIAISTSLLPDVMPTIISLPDRFRNKLGREFADDAILIDVLLKDNRIVRNLVVCGRTAIVSQWHNTPGPVEVDLDFNSEDIKAIKSNFFIVLLPFLKFLVPWQY